MPKSQPNDLAHRLADAGFTPGERHVDPILALVRDGVVERLVAERALARMGETASGLATERLATADAAVRPLLVGVIGRIAALGHAPSRAALLLALCDAEPRARRAAIVALSRVGGDDVEAQLIARWQGDEKIEERRALADSLGKVGGSAALAALGATAESDDPELKRRVAKAITTLTREAVRQDLSEIVSDVAPLSALPIVVHTRRGLEDILAGELPASFRARAVAPGVVTATLEGPLSSLDVARTWLSFGIRVPPVPVRESVSDAIAQAITSRPAREAFAAFTKGAIRYRLAFPDEAHHRSLVWEVATKVRERAPEIVNDPTSSTWEVLVVEHEKLARIELVPRAKVDPRFSYRKRDVPAASNPVIAAALARLAGVRDDDVVWDPFVGSGMELIERAKLGPFRKLFGTDLEPSALEAARENLDSAGVRATLATGDARTAKPAREVSLIITNPPMGRRVGNRADLGPLLDAFLENAARLLAPAGRLVWISPMAGTARRAVKLGLRVELTRDVDMGGFTAQIQVFSRAKPRGDMASSG